ncbi:hypothetical protein [Moraxella catarrhalis]|nr:hypothetical protein [Moraxella catarrhalis]EGE22051.1 hypothetical protein E9S_01299 [Moraxella catarrhalis BC7]
MTTGKEFRLLGLTQEQHDFLYEYAQNQLGSKSRTKHFCTWLMKK